MRTLPNLIKSTTPGDFTLIVIYYIKSVNEVKNVSMSNPVE